MAPDCVGPEVEAMRPKPGEVLLLENLRFHPEEEKNDPDFSKKLASLCDVYVNDAFGSAHRAHASTVGMIQFVKQAAAGLLMDKELEYLKKVTKNPARPCVATDWGRQSFGQDRSDREPDEGGGSAADRRRDGVHIYAGAGEPTGKSLVEEDKIDLGKQLLEKAGDKIQLPVDHVVAAEFKEGAAHEVVTTIPDDKIALDIGPDTMQLYEGFLMDSPRPSFGTGRWACSRSRLSIRGRWRWRMRWPNRTRSQWWAAAIRRRR